MVSEDIFMQQFGISPKTAAIGWIEKDDIPGLTLSSEEVRVGDMIEIDDVVHIECNNW